MPLPTVIFATEHPGLGPRYAKALADVAIVIVTYDGRPYTESTFGAVIRAPLQRPQVVIWGLDDAMAEKAQRQFGCFADPPNKKQCFVKVSTGFFDQSDPATLERIKAEIQKADIQYVED
ncbi:hypothetical protein RQP46_011102 [Phenoliferia psychrophenolica]